MAFDVPNKQLSSTAPHGIGFLFHPCRSVSIYLPILVLLVLTPGVLIGV